MNAGEGGAPSVDASAAARPAARQSGRLDKHALAAYSTLILCIALVVGVMLPARATLVWTVTLASWLALSAAIHVGWAPIAAGLYTVTAAALLKLNMGHLSGRGQLYGLLATGICALPFVVQPLKTVRGFPFIHVYCLTQGVYLYVGFVLGRPEISHLPFDMHMREMGLLTYAAFMAVFVAVGLGISMSRKPVDGPRLVDLSSVPSSPKVFARALALFVVGFAAPKLLQAADLSGGLGAIPDFLAALRLAAYGVVILLWLSNRLSVSQKGLVLILGITDALVGLSTGAVYSGVPLAFVAITLLIATERRIVWYALPLGIFVVLALNSAKTEFRVEDRRGLVQGGAIERGLNLVDMSVDNVLHGKADTYSVSATRFAYSDLLGYVVDNVPSRYPYWDKRSYKYLAFAYVPRVVSPWKPQYSLANEFGRKYGTILPTDFATSANIPIPVEAYVNLGPVGMLGIAALTSGLLGIAVRRSRRASHTHLLVGSVCATALLGGIESGLTAWIVVPPLALVLPRIARWVFGGGDVAWSSVPPTPLTDRRVRAGRAGP